MAAKRTQKPPALDAVGMVKGLPPAAQGFIDWKQFVEASSEFDGHGKGLVDTVNGNADFLNATNADLQAHKGLDDARHTALSTRVRALEDALASSPFPA